VPPTARSALNLVGVSEVRLEEGRWASKGRFLSIVSCEHKRITSQRQTLKGAAVYSRQTPAFWARVTDNTA